MAWTRAHGLHTAAWRATCGDFPSAGDDSDEAGGVREPRGPVAPDREGAVALLPGVDAHLPG